MESVNPLYFVLSVLPLVLLIVLSLKTGVRNAAIITMLITVILFFIWGAQVDYFFASLAASLSSTITILMIITGAVFLYDVMEKAGYIKEIAVSLNAIHPSEEIRFFLLSISLTAFFEGVAGFGTPGAIVPLLLISLGFNPYFAVSAVLLFNGLFAVFGAVGVPVYAGLRIPLGLSSAEVSLIERLAAFFTAAAGYLVLWFVMRLYNKFHAPMQFRGKVFLLYTFFAVPYIIFSWFAGELTSMLSAVVMLIFSLLYFYRGGEKINFKPWLPYGFLILLMLAPKIIPWLNDLLSTPAGFRNIFNTDISVFIRPLQSPLIPFVFIGLIVLSRNKNIKPDLGDLFKKILVVTLILYPTIVISQLMLNSGGVRPSMVNHIAMIFSLLGTGYIIFAPIIGISGAFITGSTTVSNIIFGPSQLETARALSFQKELILSLQLSGGSIGNAICLFNIIAAAAVAGLKTYKEILNNNLIPAISAGFIAGLLALIYYFIF
jgi:lactate permease